MNKIFIILLLSIILSSCSKKSDLYNINEVEQVTGVILTNGRNDTYKYLVITNTYNFKTDSVYDVGEIVLINKRKHKE